MKRIIVSVTNDLEGDQRVHRVCLTLSGMGARVLLVGRKISKSLPLKGRGYNTRRMGLIFNKGPLFYAEYNCRLFFFLLFSRFDLLLANDLDTLPANWMAARLKGKPIVYDSHELFTEVPELIGRPGTRRIWEWLEKRLVPRVDKTFTVSRSIASWYSGKYQVPFSVVRNLPLSRHYPFDATDDKEAGPTTILYQGALNKGRGLEQTISAMQYLPDVNLLIAGTGDVENDLKALANDLKLSNVRFLGRVPLEELIHITHESHLGISVEEDVGLNYRFALPNKLFDYIQARIPVVVSNLPEMNAIVKDYDIGLITPSHNPVELAETFRKALTDKNLRKKWSINLEKAAKDLTWEKEEQKVKVIFEKYL